MGEYGCAYVKLGRQAPENAKTPTPTGKRADLWGFCSGHRWVIVGSSLGHRSWDLVGRRASGVAPGGFIVRVIVGSSSRHRKVLRHPHGCMGSLGHVGSSSGRHWVIVGSLLSSLGRHWVIVGSLLGHHWDGVGSWGPPTGPWGMWVHHLGHPWVILGSSLGHRWVIVRPSPVGGSSLGHRWGGVGS